MDEKRKIKSTSLQSAECEDIVIRESTTIRLVFRPELVENPNDIRAGVRGTFIYQRKGSNAKWSDIATKPLTTLKGGEGFRLELRSKELLQLIEELNGLYQIHAKDGVPLGETEYVRVDSIVAQLSELPAAELRSYLSAHSELGSGLLAKLLGWAVEADDTATLVERLIGLGQSDLRRLNAAVGLQNLKRAIAIWDRGEGRDNEEFWQKTLTDNSFLLEQVFSWPVTIVKGKAYVGGKSVLDAGGNIVDFLVKNQMTQNAALVEIKTPATELLKPTPYRAGVHTVTDEVSGSVIQVANYRHSLESNFDSIKADLPLSCFAPRCIVIIGSTEQLDTEAKRRSFELFRGGLSGVQVMCFDEVFSKTRKLIELLEAAGG